MIVTADLGGLNVHLCVESCISLDEWSGNPGSQSEPIICVLIGTVT